MNQNLRDEDSENLKRFLKLFRKSFWASTANEATIDNSFKCALQLEEMFSLKENISAAEKFQENNFNPNFKKPVDELMQNILQNHHLNENLTLYAINKYISLYSRKDFSILLDNILLEIELRKQIFSLIEEIPDVDLDFFILNNFLCNLFNSLDFQNQILNSLKNNTSVFLNAIKHSLILNKEVLIEEMIICLESQTDLRLWFKLLKDENIEVVLDLCSEHDNFLKVVLKFFDKFAYEIEPNYDEELNVFYSHLNLDFEDFVKILRSFLNKESIKRTVYKYLESKSVADKNFCFWTDVQACL